MRFAIDEGAQPSVTAAAPSFLRAILGGFEVLQPGELALLAVDGNREVIDIKHIRGASITEVRVQHDDELPQSALTLQKSESLELSAVPFDALGVELGGALDYAWSSQDSSVVSIETLSDLNRVRIRAVGVGSTTIDIEVAGHTYALPVESEGDLDDGGVPEEDAGTDAGAEADAGQDGAT
jgi:hypothetical protein